MNGIHTSSEKHCAAFLADFYLLASRMLMQMIVMPKSASLNTPALSGVVQPVRIGFQPLVDCAPLLVAREMELFKKHGVKVDLSCEVGWATIREKLLYGQLDAVHAIAGLALAMRLGLSNPPCQVVAPFVFNLHGNAITLSRDLWNRGVRDAASLKKLIRSTPTRRFTFSTVSRFSSHYFLLRQWLTAGGIDAEKDVRIVVLPPTQMVGNLEAGLIDGGCVGEPWNSAAIAGGTGWIAATSEQLAPSHPEKVFLTTEKFIDGHPDEVAAIIAALKEACAFCDESDHRLKVASILHRSGYFAVGEDILKRSLVGPLDLGTGKTSDVSSFYVFHKRDANEPTQQRGQWLLNQFITHGLISSAEKAEATAALAACWTSSRLPLPQTAAAKTPSKPKKRPTPAIA
jgi:ABC-type nitrate/sulfonate/bicarbonate transport system substrate-binding protein